MTDTPDPSTRLTVADAFSLPPAQAKLVDDLLNDEQWLAQIGAREIVTALLDADSQAMANGARRLRREFERQFTDGYERGRQASFPVLCFWLLAGALGASVVWVLLWVAIG